MNADPDALRRAADEMDALIARQAAHLADIERLTAERAHIHESARERAAKIYEVRVELRRAGFPVSECDWPTDALRLLVDAHLAAEAGRQMILRCYDLLSAAGYQTGDVAERIEALIKGRSGLMYEPSGVTALTRILGGCLPSEIVDRVRDLARRLEAAELDRAGLVATTDTLRRERDDCRATLAKCHAACNGVGIAIRTDVSERAYHMAAELASLREKVQAAKPTAPKWIGPYLPTDDGCRYWVSNGASGYWVAHSKSGGGKTVGCGADEPSARHLAELLAGFDPGGIWRVAGDPVTVAVVRAVCPSVAVSWGPA